MLFKSRTLSKTGAIVMVFSLALSSFVSTPAKTVKKTVRLSTDSLTIEEDQTKTVSIKSITIKDVKKLTVKIKKNN